MANRDVAVVLSGGGINGVMMVLGFLQRLRESPLRPRLGWAFGTSARRERGEPPHLVDMITRLMRVSVPRSTLLEERVAGEEDASIRGLARLRADVGALLAGRPQLAAAVDRREAALGRARYELADRSSHATASAVSRRPPTRFRHA